MATHQDAESIRKSVRENYGRIAQEPGSSCCAQGSCCGSEEALTAEGVATAVGYSSAELATLPDGANMGLSCGNPVALASLQPGEVVVDLGSGGGFDIFLAGPRVGATGRAIGVDMTAEMLEKARKNIAVYRERSGLDNVEFRLGEIEHLPIADNSVDCIISNCVINLSALKWQVWGEIARVLKPGGRVAVSDLALLRPLPEQISGMVAALVGCIAGAAMVEETEQMVREAGLTEIVLTKRTAYVEAISGYSDLHGEVLAALPEGSKLSDYVVSLEVSAVKPRRCGCC